MTKSEAVSTEKKKKKKQPTDEVHFSSYISKASKKLSAEGSKVIVSKDALDSLDRMTDSLINALVANGRRTMKYSKGETFNLKSANGATMLTLTGILKKESVAAGEQAVEKFKSFAVPTA
jgi:ABC-type uncharacterized transport system ATPase subunit